MANGAGDLGLSVSYPGWAGAEARLRAAARGGLRREIERALRSSGLLLKEAARRGAEADLPKRGGLAKTVAGSRFSTALTVREQLTLRLTAQSQYDLEGMNRGTVVHPTFGHRPWRSQSITPGWFDRAERDVEPIVRRNMQAALTRTARQIIK